MALAERLRGAVAAAVGDGFVVGTIACESQIGSGALPLETMPSAGLTIAPVRRKGGASVDRLADALRALPVPVVGRIRDGALVLDLRCLDDEAAFATQLAALPASLSKVVPHA